MTACHGTRMSADADVSREEGMTHLTCNVMQCSSLNYWLPKLSSGSGNAKNYQDISLVSAQCSVSALKCLIAPVTMTPAQLLTPDIPPRPLAPVPEDVLWFLNNVFSASRRTDQLPLLRTRGGMEQNILRWLLKIFGEIQDIDTDRNTQELSEPGFGEEGAWHGHVLSVRCMNG